MTQAASEIQRPSELRDTQEMFTSRIRRTSDNAAHANTRNSEYLSSHPRTETFVQRRENAIRALIRSSQIEAPLRAARGASLAR